MLKPNHVYIEVSHNQSGGCRISGAKVGGCETLARFEVNAAELIEQICEHANVAGAK